MDRAEEQIHKAIVTYLRHVLPDGSIIHHSRNEGNRGGLAGIKDGARGKAMGVLPGFPDLLIYVDLKGYCIEVKDQGKNLSPVQRRVKENLEGQGIDYAVCRSVDDARKALASWGVRTKEVTFPKSGDNFRTVGVSR